MQVGRIDQRAVDAALTFLWNHAAAEIDPGGQQYEVAQNQMALGNSFVFLNIVVFFLFPGHAALGELTFAVGNKQNGAGQLLLTSPGPADVPDYAAVQHGAFVHKVLNQQQGNKQRHSDGRHNGETGQGRVQQGGSGGNRALTRPRLGKCFFPVAGVRAVRIRLRRG